MIRKKRITSNNIVADKSYLKHNKVIFFISTLIILSASIFIFRNKLFGNEKIYFNHFWSNTKPESLDLTNKDLVINQNDSNLNISSSNNSSSDNSSSDNTSSTNFTSKSFSKVKFAEEWFNKFVKTFLAYSKSKPNSIIPHLPRMLLKVK